MKVTIIKSKFILSCYNNYNNIKNNNYYHNNRTVMIVIVIILTYSKNYFTMDIHTLNKNIYIFQQKYIMKIKKHR